jgi:hypothetical protein
MEARPSSALRVGRGVNAGVKERSATNSVVTAFEGSESLYVHRTRYECFLQVDNRRHGTCH